MADEYKGLTIEFRGDTTSLSAALKKIKSEGKGVASELRTVQRALKFNPSSTALMTRGIELMRKQIDNTRKQLEAYRIAEQKIGRNNMSSEAWTKLQADIAIAEGKLKSYSRELTELAAKQQASMSILGRFGSSLQTLGNKIAPVGQVMQSAGRTLTHTLTPALIATGAASVAAAVQIDTSLTNVRKTVDGTEEQYQQLKRAAIEFSKTNAVSASEILDIQSLGAQLGFAIDELDEFSRVVSGLDIATNMDADTAATELAQFANITKMSHDDVERYGSAIVDLGNNMATTEADISSMAMRLAAAGTQVGMSQADILGLAAALSSMGVEAEAGGTAISTVMSNIDKAVATGSESLDTWAQTANMSAEQFSAAWKNDPVQALAAVLSGMESAVDEGGNMALMLDDLGIKSLRQTDVLKRLAGNSELVADAVRLSNSAWQENTALQAEVDNRNQSLSAKFEMLKNRLVAIAEQVGGPLADALLDIVDAAEPLFNAIEDGARAFSEMSKEEQQAALAAAGVVAALGPVLSLVGGGMTKVTAVGKAMSTLAEWFAKIGGAGRVAAAGIETVGAESMKAGQKINVTQVALGALKASLVGLAVGGAVATIAILVDEFKRAQEYTEDYAMATDGLKDAFGELYSSAGRVSGAIKDVDTSEVTRNYYDIRDAVRDAAHEQAEFAESMGEVFREAAGKVGELESYYSVIDRLYGKTDLTAQQQNELRTAIEKVGEITGKPIEMVQDLHGAYIGVGDGAIYAKDAILELIKVQELQTQLDAITQEKSDAFTNRAKQVETVKDAYDAWIAADEELQKMESQSSLFGADDSRMLQLKRAEVEDLERAYKNALQTRNDYNDTIENLTDNEILLSSAMDKGSESMEYAIATCDLLTKNLKEPGSSALDLSNDLSNAGVSIEDFGKLNDNALLQIASNYDGTFGSIRRILEENGVALDENKMKIVDTADAMSRSFAAVSPEVQMALSNANVSLEDFTLAMANAGVSVEDFAKLTPQQLAQVVEAYQRSTSDGVDVLKQFADNNRSYGEAAVNNWARGLSSQAKTAVMAATSMKDMTLGQFYDLTVQFGVKGDEAVTAFANALSNGVPPAEAAAYAVQQASTNALSSDDGSSESAGNQFGAGYAEGVGAADASPAGALKDNVKGIFADDGGLAQFGTEDGDGYVSAVAAADTSPISALPEGARGILASADFSPEGEQGGTGYVNAFAGVDASSVESLPQNALGSIHGLDGEFTAAGEDQGEGYRGGIESVDTSGAGKTIANNAKSGAASVSARSTGANFTAGFAAGIRSAIGSAVSAAVSMVNQAKAAADAAAASHSPSREMMKRGKWFVQGFAGGIDDNAHIAMASAREMVDDAISVLRDNDTWVYGVHTATNYAEGLYSARDDIYDATSGLSDAAASGISEADAKLQAYIDSMIAGYRSRAEDFAETSNILRDAMWNVISPEIMSKDWIMPDTGAVYDSMKAIEAAGMTFEDFKKKSEEMVEKKAEWDRKLSETNVSDSTRESYNEWFSEYDEWIKLNDGLSASFEDLERWQSLYNVKNDIIGGIEGATQSADEFSRMVNKAGVTYSKNFVDRLIAGGDDYKQAISDMADMSASEVQRMVDAFDDLARAERLEEINQRSLWVNSLKTLQTQGQNAKDWLLDYRETCLDVKESLYSNMGLSGAFEKAGVSVEGFAFDLQSLDVTMEDFESRVDSFTATVTDGFSQMTKYNQTSFEEWRRNLQLNMAESQEYAQNLAAVMNNIPDSIDSEAFRKAVLEGGFGQWGQVMADMANMSTDQVAEAVQLYNEAIVEAQQSAIEQFRALAPGEEYMLATMEGIAANEDTMIELLKDTSVQAVDGMNETYPEWLNTGVYLASGIESGIQSQVGAIAARAAAAVRAAIEAAKAAAAIGSPSRKMREEVGRMMGKGLGLGLTDEKPFISRQAKQIAQIPLYELKRSQSVNNSYFNNAGNVNNVFNITVRSESDIRKITKLQNRESMRAIAARGL